MPTESQFKAYVKVQNSGQFNMVMEARSAAMMAGLTLAEYFNVIKHYSECQKLYK